MRVLWFAPDKFDYTEEINGYHGAGWISSMFYELRKEKSVDLGVCFIMDGQPFKVKKDGVSYYPCPQHKKKIKEKFIDIWHNKEKSRDKIIWPQYLDRFRSVINDFQPEIIEIFGSEFYLGLASFVAPCPVVLHAQGFLSLCLYAFFPPGISKMNYIFQDLNFSKIYRRVQAYIYYNRSSYREKEVLSNTKHIIGRTHWDYAVTQLFNPKRIYHYGGEFLRDVFYMESSRTMPKFIRIVSTISKPMYKGFDYILVIAEILKNKVGIEFEWLVFGNVSPSFMERKTGIRHVDVNVNLMGVATAREIRDTLLTATLYFQSSYIENSPNSLAEAQILGIPVIATNVGGTSSLVEDGKTGFLIPVNDPYMAVDRILMLTYDSSLNEFIGNQAKDVAVKRHNRKKIISELLTTYKNILDNKRE